MTVISAKACHNYSARPRRLILIRMVYINLQTTSQNLWT
jgi:hypothetical protein